MMWLRREDLPRSVVINGIKYDIACDFRTWIIVDCILKDNEIEDNGKLMSIARYLGLPFFDVLNNQEAFSKEILEFHRCYKEPKKGGKTNGKRGYDFYYDYDILYASFMQQYRINILDVDMHWFEFNSLFNALGKNTPIVNAIMCRTRDISKIKDPKEREHAVEMEEYWRLPEGPKPKELTPQEIEQYLLSQIDGG